MGCKLVCATQFSRFCSFSALEAEPMFPLETPPPNVNVKMTAHRFSLKSVSCLRAPPFFRNRRPKYVVSAAVVSRAQLANAMASS